ncbi:MAG: protein phosphatase CheZ [Rhodospirillales bacterium]|nr:protein phosphatase CheZ [Rhodospirillales bacterium]
MKGYQRDQVIKIINSVIEKVHEADGVAIGGLFEQLRELKDIVEDARREISVANPSEIQSKHIPSASDELDAVVAATEKATGTIMDSCEAIQGHLDEMSAETAGVVEEHVTKIYEACSFQDITGQRISKVINSLKAIDEKVTALLNIFGHEPASETVEDEVQGDAALLNGPQMPDQAISQDEIDRLLAEFD